MLGACAHVFVRVHLAAMLQANEDIFVFFHDVSEKLHAVVNPNVLSNCALLNGGEHFVVFFVVDHVVCVVVAHGESIEDFADIVNKFLLFFYLLYNLPNGGFVFAHDTEFTASNPISRNQMCFCFYAACFCIFTILS